jgi:TRAP transporter TAXI family solute receptor
MPARSHPFLIAGIFALVALIALIVAYSALPTRLTVAVGPRDSEDYRIVSLLAQQLSAERRPVRLRVLVEDGVASAAASMEARKADLAVVRTDIKLPANGQTVVIMHSNAALFVAPTGSKLAEIAGLRGKTIGLVHGTGSNRRMLEVILNHYGIGADDVAKLMLTPKEVGAAVSDKRVDVVMAVGNTSGPILNEVVTAITKAGGGAPVFIEVPEAEAIAERMPVFDALEVTQGSFGGSPPTPAEAFTTLGNSHRLMARSDLSDTAIAALTRHIFTMRPAIANRVPLATAIEAPENDKAQVLPVHPGSLAWLAGEERTFFDRYGDWLYLGVMAVSLLGSAGALIFGTVARRRADPQRERLKRVLFILTEARNAGAPAAVHNLRAELDDLVAAALADPVVNHDEARLSAFALAVSSARNALSERAGELRAG